MSGHKPWSEIKFRSGRTSAELRKERVLDKQIALHGYVDSLRDWHTTPRWRVFRRRYLRRLANDLADIYLGQ